MPRGRPPNHERRRQIVQLYAKGLGLSEGGRCPSLRSAPGRPLTHGPARAVSGLRLKKPRPDDMRVRHAADRSLEQPPSPGRLPLPGPDRSGLAHPPGADPPGDAGPPRLRARGPPWRSVAASAPPRRPLGSARPPDAAETILDAVKGNSLNQPHWASAARKTRTGEGTVPRACVAPQRTELPGRLRGLRAPAEDGPHSGIVPALASARHPLLLQGAGDRPEPPAGPAGVDPPGNPGPSRERAVDRHEQPTTGPTVPH
jgi:hypothetical protein